MIPVELLGYIRTSSNFLGSSHSLSRRDKSQKFLANYDNLAIQHVGSEVW